MYLSPHNLFLKTFQGANPSNRRPAPAKTASQGQGSRRRPKGPEAPAEAPNRIPPWNRARGQRGGEGEVGRTRTATNYLAHAHHVAVGSLGDAGENIVTSARRCSGNSTVKPPGCLIVRSERGTC